MKISMKLVCQYREIFSDFSLTLSLLHPLQVENCDSNSRLVVDEDDNGKFRFERVKALIYLYKLVERCFFQFKIILNVLPSSFCFI